MSTRKRKAATPQSGRTVKASVLVGVELYSRWSAAAALRGVNRSAFAIEALTEATKGIVLFDRANRPDQGKIRDRHDEASVIRETAES